MVIRSGDFFMWQQEIPSVHGQGLNTAMSACGAPQHGQQFCHSFGGFPTMGEAQNGKTNGLGLGPVLFLRGDCERC